MSETEIIPSGDATDAESVDKPVEVDDTSISALIKAEMGKSEDPSPETPAEDAETSEPGADEPTEPDITPAPRSWTDDEREIWDSLPDAARDAIARRDKAYESGLRTDCELAKVIEPLAERLEGSGVHVDQYVSNMLAADTYIEQNPLQAAMSILQKHNLLEQAAEALNATPLSEPDGSAKRISELEQRLDYQAQLSTAQREWDDFTREHTDAVELREVIAAKIQANPRLDYAGAYEAAKELVAGYNGTNAQKVEAATVEAQAKAADKGKRLDLPRGKSNAAAKPSSTGNLSDDIRNALRSHGVRS